MKAEKERQRIKQEEEAKIAFKSYKEETESL